MTENKYSLKCITTAYKLINHPEIALLKIVGSLDLFSKGNWFSRIEKLSKVGYKKIILDCNETFVYDHIDPFFTNLKFPKDSNLCFVIYAKKESTIVKNYYDGILGGMLNFVLGSMQECIGYLNKY